MEEQQFDRSRATLKKKDLFTRFNVKDHKHVKDIEKSSLKSDDEILVIERLGKRLAFSMKQMAYHHVAQGELSNEPYIVNF
ncbi:DUF3179 domain-containing (seleno)protein [Pseudalkalibacillus berkeleyi]|uniref:DUF3179 domain-containing protein n=1 Tax=Pseudalkalibacillus berkeleyi TaxID=1069813 RepID=A0ABS9H1C4_9BACL|nr:DUF3179 domain-containing (seleno)protein [Pseudalkalibacillus berkeleyi]MCF6137455.1 DUF3179 domain-containing protein [Pseudalkalibacillus berkeleyi]